MCSCVLKKGDEGQESFCKVFCQLMIYLDELRTFLGRGEWRAELGWIELNYIGLGAFGLDWIGLQWIRGVCGRYGGDVKGREGRKT